MAVIHFRPEMSSDVSSGLYQLTKGHAHADPKYLLL